LLNNSSSSWKEEYAMVNLGTFFQMASTAGWPIHFIIIFHMPH
jgi:hypothetical protein